MTRVELPFPVPLSACFTNAPGKGRVPTPRGEARRFFDEVVLAHEGDECLSWPFARESQGRGVISIGGQMKLVHRLVCEIANGSPPTPSHHAAHSCGKGHEACVARRHLSWKTPAENESDKLGHGTHNRGSRNRSALLCDDDVEKIRALRGRATQRKIAEEFGVSEMQIWRIQTGRAWL